MRRWAIRFGGALLALIATAALLLALFGWNWLRAPLSQLVLAETGRVLVLEGDVSVQLAWPRPRVRFAGVRFANPAWAQERQMLEADAAEITVDLPELLRGRVLLPEVHLDNATLYLEQGPDNRRNWLLDTRQQDDATAIRVGQLTLLSGTIGFDDGAARTHLRADVSTTGDASGAGVRFDGRGQLRGQAVTASGRGGPVLALRELDKPYPLQIDATIGKTRVQAEGSITGLANLTAVDMQLALRGDNLADLFPVLGIALPATRAYRTQGRLQHAGTRWTYAGFSGLVGASDIAGTLHVDTGGPRPVLQAELVSKVLDIVDLGPMIGARSGTVQAARQGAATNAVRVLPDLPFTTDRWNSVDADVALRVGAIRRARELPLDNLVVRLRLQDALLTLDPIAVGVAGGKLQGSVSLDGRKTPLVARVRLQVRGLRLARLFPTVDLNRNSIGQIHGEFDLTGSGPSVGRMLATANGKVGLVVAGGEISRLMMEQAGLHIWEILQLRLGGDERIRLRCAVADFVVRDGNMHADALVFDTTVTTLRGTGNINLARETLDLRFEQDTKATSPLALRSPLLVRGSFAKPEVGVDKTQVAARAIGAVVLGLINPLLALVPLIDAGPGADSDCGALVRAARAPVAKRAGTP
ncbi:MAG: AsmA family protein [Rhodoferax sp.]|nr:AsmA family protein [Rhodoferax sp.]